MIRFSVFYWEIKNRGSNLDHYVFVFYMFSNPWKGHRCCQWLVPHYEFKNIVGGINLWSVNQHKGKFPSLVARQPPPIKITIKSHAFYAGINNSRMQLLAFKETRRQTTSEIFIACPLMIRNREWKCIQATFSGGSASRPIIPTLDVTAALREDGYSVLRPPTNQRNFTHMHLQASETSPRK